MSSHLLLLCRKPHLLSLAPKFLLDSNRTQKSFLKPIIIPYVAAHPRFFCSSDLSDLHHRVNLLTEKPDTSSIYSDGELDGLRSQIETLASSLLSSENPLSVLDSLCTDNLLSGHPKGFTSLYLLSRLKSQPLIALKVFDWMTQRADGNSSVIPIHAEHFAKAIGLAGRSKNPELAEQLFAQARTRGLLGTSVYNALMTAYMINGLGKKSVSIFEDLKKNRECIPTIVSYNILLSIFGRSMLVDRMETVMRTIDKSMLSPNLNTFNTLIAGYITSWMWDRMESTFLSMESRSIQPTAETHLLMLRGYAHSGELEKMEKFYESVKDLVNNRDPTLIRAMICAYCKSKDPERVRKIEQLRNFIPEEEYRPWLNVLLIRLYAQEGLLEKMEQFILEALQHDTVVTTVGVMRSIISNYFRSNNVERLADFVKQAEFSGWKLCRSLYHCLMVMYGQQDRLVEMHGVLDEMEVNRFDRTKKTFLIMANAYSGTGRTWAVDTIIAILWKQGHLRPEDEFSWRYCT